MKKLSILGSTGSIGQSALELVDLYPDRFQVAALAARSSTELLLRQCRRYQPQLVALEREDAAEELRHRLSGIRVVSGEAGVVEAACFPASDMVLSAVMGSAGLKPTYEAVRAGKDVALANKESLVMSGRLLMSLAAESGVAVVPVDSEHSALHQCLRGVSSPAEVRRLVLTASGGPFLNLSKEELRTVTVEQALAHPTWEMGPKITIDSATLMNKGLEVIEAHYFFGFEAKRIEVAVHPQSLVHSIVEFTDGTMLAQLSNTDMKIALLYAFAYPERWHSRLPALDLFSMPPLEFRPPDIDRFPCLALAYEALRRGGTYPAALNGANETAVRLFLEGTLSFQGIPRVIEGVLERHSSGEASELEEILAVDSEARLQAESLADELTGCSRPGERLPGTS